MSKEINDRMMSLCVETSAMISRFKTIYPNHYYLENCLENFLEGEMEEQFRFIQNEQTGEEIAELVGKIFDADKALKDARYNLKSSIVQHLRDGRITQEQYKQFLGLIVTFSVGG